MTGKQLLERLQQLTPEELQLEVVARDNDWWYYSLNDVDFRNVEEGRETDDDDEAEPNVIALI